MKVFIADDSLLVCARLISMLTEFNKIEIVGHAQDAQDAIVMIGELKPDVAILDIQLKQGSGIDVLRQGKNQRPSMIAIMLSNHSTAYYRTKCLDAGANFFFDKSTEFFALQELLGELIRSPDRPPHFDWTNKILVRFSE